MRHDHLSHRQQICAERLFQGSRDILLRRTHTCMFGNQYSSCQVGLAVISWQHLSALTNPRAHLTRLLLCCS